MSLILPSPFDPLHKLRPDEPYFMLRASDVLACPLVRVWCGEATVLGVNPLKIADARQIAEAMLHWPFRKVPD